MDDRIARGVNFLYAREYVIRQYGSAGWERVVDRMPPEAAADWRGTLIAIRIYSFSSFKALAPALAAETGEGSDESLAKMYEYVADRSLNVLYKVFFRLANPAFVVSNYPRLWSRFFTAGKVQVTEAAAGGAIVQFTLPAVFLDWLPAACLGYSTKAVSMAGGRALSLRELAKTEGPVGEWTVSYQLRWEE